MCDEADCVAVAAFSSFWLLLSDNHCKFTETLGRQYIRIKITQVSKSGASKCLGVLDFESGIGKKVKVTLVQGPRFCIGRRPIGGVEV
jgi:PHP family Zn ribbon phosphoesterase